MVTIQDGAQCLLASILALRWAYVGMSRRMAEWESWSPMAATVLVVHESTNVQPFIDVWMVAMVDRLLILADRGMCERVSH
jgi:hypothetical protein